VGSPRFGPAERLAALDGMAGRPLDLLVVGGGITGCGLARDAALRGLSVGLVERDDFGSGTSSRSSKLVHGGVRYLAYGDVALVRESAHERRVLAAIAPHLVHPLAFVFPLFRGDSRAKLRIGFTMFDRLAGSPPGQRHRVLAADEVRQRVPGLREPLAGGFLFTEYITDDARLTLENAISAFEHGALVANHAAAVSFPVEGGRLAGARVRDELSGEVREVRAAVVVNATGPWAEETIALGDTPVPKHVLPSKGIHLLFRADRLPLEGAVALRSPSGREGFAIRRRDHVYVGTSDVVHRGPLGGPVADREAFDDVLEMARDCFPTLGLGEADVAATWAGLRPLIAEEGKSPRDTSRHDEVWRSPEGLLSIVGGKLTTYRRMGERVMEQVGRELGRDLGPGAGAGSERDPGSGAQAEAGAGAEAEPGAGASAGPSAVGGTADVPLPGARLGGRSLDAFRSETVASLTGRGVALGAADRIAWLYGGAAEDLLRLGDEDPGWLAPLAPGSDALRGEVRLAVERGMALALADILDRRTGLLLFGSDRGLAEAPAAAEIAGRLLGWDDATRQAQLDAFRALSAQHGVPGPTG